MTARSRCATPAENEGGWATVWVLGLCVLMLGLGGITIDLWRSLSERRALISAVDAAAVAGTSGLDEAALRANRALRLDPVRARALALQNLADQTEVRITAADVVVDGDAVTVVAHTKVELSLVRILMAGEPLDVAASATARPRRGS